MIGPFSQRLMEWVHEEGHCSAEMLAWDWDAFGLRLVTTEEGAGRAGGRQGGDHRDDQQPHQGRAVRRGPAPPGAAGAGRHRRRARRRRAPARPGVLDDRRRPDRAPARSSRRSAWPLPVLPAPPAGRRPTRLGAAGPARAVARAGRRDAGPPAARRPQGRRPHVGLRRPAGHPGARRLRRHRRQGRGRPRHPDASAAAAARAVRATSSLEGSVAVRPLQRRQARPQPRPRRPDAGRDGPARPRALGRRARRVVHARRDGRVGPRLRRPAARSTRSW